jgi:asparagine N-glycosylation enzyme membrane subunit Stt3
MTVAILGALGLFFGLFQDLRLMMQDPKKRILIVWIVLLVLFGSFFYHQVEGWSWIDSFYFSVVALTTVGFGDLTPTTAWSKFFTTVYILVGLSIFVTFADAVVKTHVHRVAQKRGVKGEDNTATGED